MQLLVNRAPAPPPHDEVRQTRRPGKPMSPYWRPAEHCEPGFHSRFCCQPSPAAPRLSRELTGQTVEVGFDPVPLTTPGYDHCSVTGRVGPPGATKFDPVFQTPKLDVCPGGLATTYAQ